MSGTTMMPIRVVLFCALAAIDGSPFAARAIGAESEPAAPEVFAADLLDAADETAAVEPASFAADLNLQADPTAAQRVAAAKRRADLQKTVAGAYKPLFYDNNFAFVNSPLYNQSFLGDSLKRMSIGNLATVDIGGQFRYRYHNEQNFRGFGLTGVDDNFLLQRTRLFANVEIGDRIRIYGEMIDAVSQFENVLPRAIEENRFDMQNLFGDLLILDGGRGKLKFRGGRQELLYGSERLVSPLDWANTRRTFEGYRFLWAGQDWNVDAFYTNPVLTDYKNPDSADHLQEFSGVFSTYKGVTNHTFDAYWFSFFNNRGANHFKYETVGGRWLGADGPLLWELEGGVQFGDNTSGSDHWANYLTVGGGKKNEAHPWKPVLWFYYDYASGGASRGAGEGMNHLFPLGHKYLGFMDLYARSNIQSPNAQLTLQPHEKLKVLVWYYYFALVDRRDTPYNVNMTAFNAANAPAAKELGQELDLIFTYTITPRNDVLFGYSHFFSGDYYRLTPGVPFRGDANFYYLQYQWNF